MNDERARFDFSINEDVRVDGLHGLAPIHQVKQRVAIQQVNPREFNGFPSPETQLVRFPWTDPQSAAKKIICHCLEGTAFFGGFLFQLKKELIVNRQSGSFHVQKHIMLASRCQTRTNAELCDDELWKATDRRAFSPFISHHLNEVQLDHTDPRP